MHQSVNYNDLWMTVYGDMQQYGPVHRHMRRIIQSLIRKIDFHTVADIGCGYGHNIPIYGMNRTLTRLVGIDISKKAIEYCRNHYVGRFVQMDVQKTTLKGAYDLVFCSLLLEHIVHDQLVIKKLCTITKKYLLITTMAGDFNRYARYERQMGHVRNYTRGSIERLLEKRGFKCTSIYWGYPFYSPIGRWFINKQKSKHTFSIIDRIVSYIVYVFYFLNSWNKGDLLIILAYKNR